MTPHSASVPTATDMNVLVRPDRRDALLDAVDAALTGLGATGVEVELRSVESACEPDNMLVADYLQRFDTPPVGEQVHRLTVTAHWPGAAPATADVTRAVAGCLPSAPDGSPGLWFGQTTTLRSSE
ncbi:hypothetical protein [Corynebacterium kalidii]|uniref:Uncharacterized protein n=1 Tax=Corynebacterium kalidii TaxID=2931982 RepID=A0A9X2B037_9CORY|nr:hypothetical protein [Corynebacterium kalidii]MCJ7859438.1 hypothetical protein [Corynebacterium kalidii]